MMRHPHGSQVDLTGVVTAVADHGHSVIVQVASLRDGGYRHNTVVARSVQGRATASELRVDQTVSIAAWIGAVEFDEGAVDDSPTLFADQIEPVGSLEPHRNNVRVTGAVEHIYNKGKAVGVTLRAADPEGFDRFYSAVTFDPTIGQSLSEMKSGDSVTLAGGISERQRSYLDKGNPPDHDDPDEWVEYRSVSITISSVVEHEPFAQPAPLPVEASKQEWEPTLANRVAGLFRRPR